jgi:hypothetical protein
MKIVEFFLFIWGKLSELKPELEFFTSWSRTKKDWLRNTGIHLAGLSLGLCYDLCAGETALAP